MSASRWVRDVGHMIKHSAGHSRGRSILCMLHRLSSHECPGKLQSESDPDPRVHFKSNLSFASVNGLGSCFRIYFVIASFGLGSQNKLFANEEDRSFPQVESTSLLSNLSRISVTELQTSHVACAGDPISPDRSAGHFSSPGPTVP